MEATRVDKPIPRKWTLPSDEQRHYQSTHTSSVGIHERSPCSESDARMVRLWYRLRSVQRLGHLHNSVLRS